MHNNLENLKSYKKLLVHTCCAPCSTYVFEKLISENFSIEGFFYNPNIHPHEEYTRRLEELLLYSEIKKYKISVKNEPPNRWHETMLGLEQEKEGGTRCRLCFQLRLEETAIFAKKRNFDGFTTTLTISPHKNAKIINEIGKELEAKYNIYFLGADFKKNDGFKKSLDLSQKYNLYRQSYCGCEFSIRN
ncbi:MAG: hypothetical protein A2287_03475 [Candidatus Melainabacteria bacterium RIFOXYA12_FULL_32_12]|nr:MAG: hypothetical protein A2255_11025 [Candidatus Melainabacteria bacterium RIFOXYA2_FULL_32_9]OGI28479.1 MAG: hypothetical protein A2287_03475 [Candidatus Melainabacteria bacterium RIFOXYA12_FULL_32_12]